MEYGKRPLWHWILLYVVIGGIIYALVYYFVIAKKGGYSYNPTNYNYASTSPAEVNSPQGTVRHDVILSTNGFEPQTVTIKTGETVTWFNKSGAPISINSAAHPTHQVYPPLNLGEVADGQSVSLAFPTAGTYKYHNHLNPSQTGTVIVE